MRPAMVPLIALLQLLTAFPAPIAHAALPFAAYHEGYYPAGAVPGSLGGWEGWYGTAADLNGDGRDELITGRWDVSTGRAILQVRSFGAAPWDLSTAAYYDVGRFIPGKCEVADLDGDSHLDLVVPVSDTITILPGTGPGSFGPPVSLQVPGNEAVAVADFDADGIRDLAVTLFASDRLQIWRGTGSFGFALFGDYPTHDRPGDPSVVDLNADDFPDLVVSADTVSIALLGDGSGNFSPIDIPAHQARAAGDLNGDGHEDILTLDGAGLGNGDGTFQALLPFPSLIGCAAADLDEDGRLDLVGKKSGAPIGMISVQKGLGTGMFGPSTFPAPRSTQSPTLAIGDYDGDGHLDVAEPGRNVDPDAVHFGRGNGKFFAPRQVFLTSPARFVAAGVLGGNPQPDLLVASSAANSMSVLLSTGLGSWTSPDTLILPGKPGGRRPALADLDLDGRDDVVLAYSDLASLSVWLTQADGHPGVRTDLATPEVGTSDVEVADLDDDGVPDIVFQPGLPAPQAGSSLRWFRGLGSGTFAPFQALPIIARRCFAVGDLSGDGIPDIACPTHNLSITVAIASSPGVFPSPVTIPVPQLIPDLYQIVIGNLNSDAYPDLALKANSMTLVLHGLGGGAFGTPVSLGPSSVGTSFSVAEDLDGDSVDELVSGFINSKGIQLLRLNPDGSLLSESHLGISPSTSGSGLAVADVDGNGTPDIVSGVSQRPTLDILLNRKPPEVLSVQPSKPGVRGLTLAPLADPARGLLVFRIGTTLGSSIRVELLDLQGRSLRTVTVRPNPGSATSVSLGESASLPSGVYFARARQDGRTVSTRVSVLH